jgi:hypothetical protein
MGAIKKEADSPVRFTDAEIRCHRCGHWLRAFVALDGATVTVEWPSPPASSVHADVRLVAEPHDCAPEDPDRRSARRIALLAAALVNAIREEVDSR